MRFRTLLGLATVSVLAFAGVTSASAKEVRIAMVVKALGIGFFDAARDGGQEAAKQLGDVQLIYTGPTTTTAEAQI
jgi:rhamnose transport system substrate-binding protein